MTKLSFIIPNYNSGHLLKRCIMSIISSNSCNFEIIIVDDGSSDNSIDLVNGLDNRITIIRQKNMGVSTARNNGVAQASGDYIAFVDADDTLCNNWDRYVFEDINRKVDLVTFNYINNNSKISINNQNKLLENNESIQWKRQAIENPTKNLTVWGKLFSRTLIKKHYLSFDDHLRLAEDGDFMIQYLIVANKIYTSTHYFYHYQNNENSVMRTFDPHKVDDYLISLKATRNKIKNEDSLKAAYKYYVLMHLNVMMVHEVFDIDNSKSYSQKINQLKQVMNIPIISSSLGEVSISECHSPRMVPILLLKLRLYKLAGLIYKMRSRHNHHV